MKWLADWYMLATACPNGRLQNWLSLHPERVQISGLPQNLQKLCAHRDPVPTQAPVLGLNSSRGVFTLVPTMYCTQAQCPRMTKCELCLRNNTIFFTSSFSRYSKVSFNITGTVQKNKRSSVQCNYHQRMKRLNWVSKLLLELIFHYSLWSFLVVVLVAVV